MPDWDAITRGARTYEPDSGAVAFPNVPPPLGTSEKAENPSIDAGFPAFFNDLAEGVETPNVPKRWEQCSQSTMSYLGTFDPLKNKDLGQMFPCSQCSQEKIEGGQKEDEKDRGFTHSTQAAGGAGMRVSSSRSRIKTEPFPLDPAVCVWLVRWVEHKETGDIADLYDSLGALPPNEQRNRMIKLMAEAGLNPWLLLALPLPPEGRECMQCQHFIGTVGRLDDGDRRRFWWACAKGYQMLVYARASERIATAPPECIQWERWKPGKSRQPAGQKGTPEGFGEG